MLSKLHSRLGTAGFVVAIVALIAAVAGTAIAATGLNSKQKKEVKAIAKSVAKPGAPGPAGPAGPAGPKGADGAQGPAGKDGAGVTVTPATAGECTEGGVKITTGNGVSANVCDGEEGDAGEPGQSGFTKTLPPGETETGVWSLSAPASTTGFSALVSFPFAIPLEEKLPGEHSHFLNHDGKEIVANLDEEREEEVDSTVCVGSVAAPMAPPGHLCIYTKELANASSSQSSFINPETGNRGPNGENVTSALTGALLEFAVPGGNEGELGGSPKAFGTWAVTACPEGGCVP